MLKKTFDKIKLPLFIIAFFIALSFLWQLLGLPPEEKLIVLAKVYFAKWGVITVLIAAIFEGALLAGWYVPGGLVIFLGVIFSKDLSQVTLSVSATIIGFLIAYIINFYTGKYGWYRALLKLGVKNSLEKAQKEFGTHGFKTIYLSYWEPNLASLISTAAGIAQASFKKFFINSILATTFWAIFWGSITYIYGQKILEYLGYIFFAVMVGWIVYIVIKHRKTQLQ
jgi:membrane protein DedA with SNARE-associated domain